MTCNEDFACNTGQIEETIGYRFSQVKLLVISLTHSSYANERGQNADDNERLEFLGDAVLELCVSQELFNRFPTAEEGQLTRMRARMVNETALAVVARKLGLDKHIHLGKGEDAQGGRERPSVLSDVFEALVGAIFLDSGYMSARDFVVRVFDGIWPQAPDVPSVKDYKSRLQELTQKLFRERPNYQLMACTGPEHAKVFLVRLTLPNGEICEAVGPNRRKAEQTAAAQALDSLLNASEDFS